MPRKIRRLALLAKRETTYGTDAAPTAANKIIATNVVLTPMAGSEERRDLLLPYLGHQGMILTGSHAMIEMSIEIAGAGDAGDVPLYGVILRACGLSETISAGVSVEYEPVSAGEEAVTLYYNLDGVCHILLGARGTITQIDLTPQRIPRYRFRLLGLEGTISDTALPSYNAADLQTPLIVSKANTAAELHGYSGPIEGASFDLGNTIEPRLLMNKESIELVNREMTGSVIVEAALLATKNWFALSKARARDTFEIVHGTTAGNIVEFSGPAAELGRISQGESQGIANYTVPLLICPDQGNDEFKITVR